jgi:Na+/H+ antiporter NhaD/arsenite permease-like protein
MLLSLDLSGLIADAVHNSTAWSDDSAPELSSHSYVAIILCFLCMIGIIHPFRLTLSARWPSFLVDFCSSSVLLILLLALSGCLSWANFSAGIIGSAQSNVQPYSILLIFFSMSYICIALDSSGFLAFVAVVATSRATTGPQLIFLTYFLAGLITVVTSNDIVILTLTPLVCHFCAHFNIAPFPYLLAAFLSANAWSSILYISNATNIIVAESFGCSFIKYSAWMTLPAITSGLCCYFVLYLVFRSELPTQLAARSGETSQNPAELLFKNRPQGYFNLCLFSVAVFTLIITSFWTIPLWAVTTPLATMALARDLWQDRRDYVSRRAVTSEESRKDGSSIASDSYFSGESPESPMLLSSSGATPRKSRSNVGKNVQQNGEESSAVNLNTAEITESTETSHNSGDLGPNSPLLELSSSNSEVSGSKLARFHANLSGSLPCSYAVFSELPWKTVPFLFSMFIAVEALDSLGWINLLAVKLATLSHSTALFAMILCFLACFCCIFMSNQPMTILFCRILTSPAFAAAATDSARETGLFSVVLASNNGPNLALSAALAGLLFQGLLQKKGHSISYVKFLRFGGGIMIPAIVMSSTVLIAEDWIVNGRVS